MFSGFIRAFASAILALGVVALMAYLIAKEVEFPVPKAESRLTVDFVEAPCSNVEFLHEQLSKKIDASKDCKVDDDCGVMFLGCPFGCRTAINHSKIAETQSFADLVPSQCRTCVYRCMGGDFREICDAGTCRSVKVDPVIQRGIEDIGMAMPLAVSRLR